MDNPQGRWFKFSLGTDSILIIEKKGVSEHLQGLPFVDNASTLSEIIRSLQDAGEAGHSLILVA